MERKSRTLPAIASRPEGNRGPWFAIFRNCGFGLATLAHRDASLSQHRANPPRIRGRCDFRARIRGLVDTVFAAAEFRRFGSGTDASRSWRRGGRLDESLRTPPAAHREVGRLSKVTRRTQRSCWYRCSVGAVHAGAEQIREPTAQSSPVASRREKRTAPLHRRSPLAVRPSFLHTARRCPRPNSRHHK